MPSSEDPILLDCHCSVKRMETAIALLGQHTLAPILKDQAVVEIACETCGNTYAFDTQALKDILDTASQWPVHSTQIH